MIDTMRHLVLDYDIDFSFEERYLFQTAFRNAFETRQESWKILKTIEENEGANGFNQNIFDIASYIERVEHEMRIICYEVLIALLPKLSMNAVNQIAHSFYSDMFVIIPYGH